MANVLTRNIWNCASLGIISPGPVLVKAIMYYPNAIDGAFTLKWWDEDNPAVTTGPISYVASTSTDDTITSVGNFPNTFLDGAVVKCLKTTGSDSGVYGLIQTAGSDDAIVLWGSPFTASATTYVGEFNSFPSYTAFRGHASNATDTETSMWFPFGKGGMVFPNLALDSLSTSDAIIIYVG
jgi:hypothetical protein